MRPFPLLLCVLLAFVSGVQAAPSIIEEGTLTLSGDKVIFQTKDKTTEFPSDKIPGLVTIDFEKRVIATNGNEIDVSKLTLLCPQNQQKIVLIAEQPLTVTHQVVSPSADHTWAQRK